MVYGHFSFNTSFNEGPSKPEQVASGYIATRLAHRFSVERVRAPHSEDPATATLPGLLERKRSRFCLTTDD